MSSMGVTPPISSSPPTLKEEQYNKELATFLTLHRIAESEEGNRKRKRTVDLLLDVFKQWVTEVGLKRGVVESDCVAGAGARLFVFGSQRLGVHSPDADIDILCCAPQFVTRYDFFLSFLDKLQSMENVIDILSLPDAYTPVIKFSLNNLSIDLVFASLAMPYIPEDIDILDNKNLKKLDEASIRSLNGVRVTEMIIKLVPNQETFCVALRAIKCWATRRGIYGNVLGFLGGVNYAILVAFVCQRFPQACPSTIIHQFFKIFSQWHWPAPIILTKVTEVDNVDQTDMIRMPSWNPKLFPSDGFHLMPIITPAFPSMNSAFNVNIPQFRMIQLEVQRGLFLFETMENMPSNNPSSESDSTITSDGDQRDSRGSISSTSNTVPFLPQSILWNTLFSSAATDFFQLFPRYIQIDIIAETAEAHRQWFGWCESRLRQLFVSIEQSQMVFCHPYANCFHRQVPVSNNRRAQGDEKNCQFSSSFFIGLSFPERTRSLDMTEVIQSFKYRVCSWVGKTDKMDLKLKPLEGRDLPDFVFSEISFPSNANIIGCSGRPPMSGDGRSSIIPGGSVQYPATPINAAGATVPVKQQSQAPASSSKGVIGKTLHQSGSTPTLALLALNNDTKEKEANPDAVHLDDAVSDKNTVRIEKQLFSDGKREKILDDHVNISRSEKNSCGDKNSGVCRPTALSCSAPHLDAPLPSASVRSPFKTTRKEFATLTETVVVPSQQQLDEKLSRAQDVAGQEQETGSGNGAYEHNATAMVTSPQHEENTDDGETLPCFSSPLKRVRPN